VSERSGGRRAIDAPLSLETVGRRGSGGSTYIRNSWGTPLAVPTSDVESARRQLSQRSDCQAPRKRRESSHPNGLDPAASVSKRWPIFGPARRISCLRPRIGTAA